MVENEGKRCQNCYGMDDDIEHLAAFYLIFYHFLKISFKILSFSYNFPLVRIGRVAHLEGLCGSARVPRRPLPTGACLHEELAAEARERVAGARRGRLPRDRRLLPASAAVMAPGGEGEEA